MTPNMVALVAQDGRTWTVNVVDEDVKIKGLGVFNPVQMLEEHALGGLVVLAGKELTILPAGLAELRRGMLRRAQTIGDKDAGILVARLASVVTTPFWKRGLEALDWPCTSRVLWAPLATTSPSNHGKSTRTLAWTT